MDVPTLQMSELRQASVSFRESVPVGSAVSKALSQQHKESQSLCLGVDQPQYTLVPPTWETLTGVSKQHQKIEQKVSKAAGNHLPLFISGEAGLDTLRIAVAVHTLGLDSKGANQALVQVDCSSPSGCSQAFRLLSGPAGLADPADSMALENAHILLKHLAHGTLALTHLDRAPIDLLGLVDSAVAALTNSETGAPNSGYLPGGSKAGDLLQSLGTRLILLSQVSPNQLGAPLTQPHRSGSGLSGPSSGGRPDNQAASDSLQAYSSSASSSADSQIGSSTAAQGLSRCSHIAVQPLRNRASDIAPLALHSANIQARLRGYGSAVMTPAAVSKLVAYQFPGNDIELQQLVQSAIMLQPNASPCSSSCSCSGKCSGSSSTCSTCSGDCSHTACACSNKPQLVLDAKDFKIATAGGAEDWVDLLELLPWLKSGIMGSDFWPHGLNSITKWLFPLLVASLFLGPQDREHSAALTLFWAGWWPLVMASFPLVGRAWCAMCPFMVMGEQAQDIVSKDTNSTPQQATAGTAQTAASTAADATTAGPATGNGASGSYTTNTALIDVMRHRWRKVQRLMPRDLRWKLNKDWPTAVKTYGRWFSVAGVAAILMSEEVWNLPDNAELSGWLLLLITAGAVACSVVFEKRMWCKELCPIGAMNGLFAKLSLTEIRSRPAMCAAAACGRPCNKGKALTETNTALPGCPMGMYPGAHKDNSDCIMCGNCLRSCHTCASGSAQWRLRPPAADLCGDHSVSAEEVSLMYVLLGAVLLHRLPELCAQFGVSADTLLSQQGPHLAASALLLAAPGAVAWAWSTAGAALAWQIMKTQGGTTDKSARTEPAAAAELVTARNNSTTATAEKLAKTFKGSERPMGVPYMKLAYSLLPLVWASTSAYYEKMLLTELGLTVPRLAASLGVDGGWASPLPAVGPVPDATVSAAQAVTLVAGAICSCALAGKVAEKEVSSEQAAVAALSQRVLILAMTVELWHLIV